MIVSNRWLVLSVLIAAAIGCYLIGFRLGLTLFLVLGVLFELGFWFKLLKGPKTGPKNDSESHGAGNDLETRN